MSVNGIRKHCTDEDVVNLAKILIKNWKKLLGKGNILMKKILKSDTDQIDSKSHLKQVHNTFMLFIYAV